MLKRGANPTMSELDRRQGAGAVWLGQCYLEDDDNAISMMAYENRYFEGLGIDKDTPSYFSTISPATFTQAIDYLNHWYRVCYKNYQKSGTHDNEFENFVHSRPYIYYYHRWLQDVPILLTLRCRLSLTMWHVIA